MPELEQINNHRIEELLKHIDKKDLAIIFKTYLDETCLLLVGIENAIEKRNIPALKNLFHQWNGSSATIGLDKFVNWLTEIELALAKSIPDNLKHDTLFHFSFVEEALKSKIETLTTT